MTHISLEISLYRCRKLRRSLLTFLKFCSIFVFFTFFSKFPKYSFPVFGWNTSLLKLKIWLLQRTPKPENSNISLMRPPLHSKWPYLDTGSSWDHFWHFWNVVNFCVFLTFLEIPKILNILYWLRYSTFKVEGMASTKESKT